MAATVSSISMCPGADAFPASRRLAHTQAGESGTKDNTHNEVEADGVLLFLTSVAEIDKFPLASLLYSSDSEVEPVLESSESEFESESEEDCRP
jgi:hypothetical protein